MLAVTALPLFLFTTNLTITNSPSMAVSIDCATNAIAAVATTNFVTNNGIVWQFGMLSQAAIQLNFQYTNSFYIFTDPRSTKNSPSTAIGSNPLPSTIFFLTELMDTYTFTIPPVLASPSYSNVFFSTNTLRYAVATNMAFYTARTNMLWSWGYFAQQQAWTQGLDFSGIAVDAKLHSIQYITLFAPDKGICAGHAPPLNGDTCVTYDINSRPIATNTILSQSSVPGTDVDVVFFSTSWPSSCANYPILPTNYWLYDPVFRTNTVKGGELPFQMISINANFNRIEDRGVNGFSKSCSTIGANGIAFPSSTAIPNCAFTSSLLWSGGQSGTPVFFLVSNQLVLTGSFSCGDGEYPWLSDQATYLGIQTIIGGTTYPKIVNLAGMQTFP